MTASQLYLMITQMLEKAGCDSPAFDACCILEDIGGMPHGHHIESDYTILSEEKSTAVLSAATRRAKGEPLQYILGAWDFLSLTLDVGEGVLIPRPDTELLCEVVAERLPRDRDVKVLDLCAGSGCVGLGIWSLNSRAQITSVELSDDALVYLRRNVNRYPAANVTIVKDNVLLPNENYDSYEAIVSNPPYIPSADMEGLMREVQHEPRMALDGDQDGLLFYRAILTNWLPKLRIDGILAVEVGIGQAQDVAVMFEKAGLSEIDVFRDFGGIDRVVYGCRKNPEKI